MTKPRTVIITGANAGIGLETAHALARQGDRVIMTARDPKRGADALTQVRQKSGNQSVELMILDLASFASISQFAREFSDNNDELDVLINNAGLVLSKREETAEGFEMTFGVNHLGHFLLTQKLGNVLTGTKDSRVVVVSSHAHKFAKNGLDFDDLQAEKSYSAFKVYGKSKLANIYFARELARRWPGVKVNSLHPGFVRSRFGLDGDNSRIMEIAMYPIRPFAISPTKGARTSIYLASESDIGTGDYYFRCHTSTPSVAARNDEAARRLWAISEELTARG
ncbi:MAG: SDR family oxidoreductase [Actinobacteria bacterium]|nr:SDR family oxidoreductase [Actinomycetota bacterium]